MSSINPMKTYTDISTKYVHPFAWLAGVALCLLALIAPALAADLGVDPVIVELTAKQQTATITISNQSDQPTSIQIQAVAWSQRNGEDVYTPSKELLVSPPIVTIGPKGEQIIRLALRRKADPARELSYRIYLQELPQQPAPGFTGLHFALRIGLPVFVKQPVEPAPKMVWSVARLPDQFLKVTLHNQGSAHVQVSDFAFYVPGAEKVIAGESGSTYVLAGQTREWRVKGDIPANVPNERVRLKANTDMGNIDTVLALQKP